MDVHGEQRTLSLDKLRIVCIESNKRWDGVAVGGWQSFNAGWLSRTLFVGDRE